MSVKGKYSGKESFNKVGKIAEIILLKAMSFGGSNFSEF